MVYTRKKWKEKIEKDVAFESEYLVTCIHAKHSNDEIIEYCRRRANNLEELELINRTEK